MARITKVYTRTGDQGTTGLGSGARVSKSSLRIESYGTVDELNACMGLCALHCNGDELAGWIQKIQNDLFDLGSDLCVPEDDKKKWNIPGIEKEHVDWLEKIIDHCQESLKPLEEFILPGGTPGAAHLHVARTVCRRAERILVDLMAEEDTGPWVLAYLNRLSDLLFVLARFQNLQEGVEDIYWKRD